MRRERGRRRVSRFRAMGVEVVVGGAQPGELAAVADLFASWDASFSRFRPDSELVRVNASPADAIVVSSTFARAVDVALDAAALTGGLVDPTLGAAIVEAGYDRDFAQLADDGRPPAPAPAPGTGAVRLTGRLLARPRGTVLDLNGVVKALAVDEALALLAGPGFVAAGGDVAVRGAVVAGLPAGGAVRLLDGGLATSGPTRRRWTRGGEPQHHLLDPATGRPARSRWTAVTVAAATCLASDVAAKAAFLLSDDGPGWLDERNLPGRFVDGDAIVRNRSWNASAGVTAGAAA